MVVVEVAIVEAVAAVVFIAVDSRLDSRERDRDLADFQICSKNPTRSVNDDLRLLLLLLLLLLLSPGLSSAMLCYILLLLLMAAVVVGVTYSTPAPHPHFMLCISPSPSLPTSPPSGRKIFFLDFDCLFKKIIFF